MMVIKRIFFCLNIGDIEETEVIYFFVYIWYFLVRDFILGWSYRGGLKDFLRIYFLYRKELFFF